MRTKAYLAMAILGVLCLAVMFSAMAKDQPAPAPAAAPAKGPTMLLPVTLMASVEIKAPVEKVFKYGTNAANLPKWMPECKSVTDIQAKGLGQTFHWAVEVDGQKIEGQSVVVDYVLNKREEVLDTDGTSWVILYLPAAGGGTKLMMNYQVHLVVPAQDPTAWPEVIKKNQERFQGWANNIKAEVEKK